MSDILYNNVIQKKERRDDIRKEGKESSAERT